MTYAEAIKLLREKMVLSQSDLAKELGVSFASVNRWERGRYQPTFAIKRKLIPYFKKYKIKVGE